MAAATVLRGAGIASEPRVGPRAPKGSKLATVAPAPREKFDLAARCPRLAQAHRQRRVELAAERDARRRARELHTRAEWAVAHRELQLIRAEATRDGAYIARRMRKLKQAQSRLRLAEKWMRKVGA